MFSLSYFFPNLLFCSPITSPLLQGHTMAPPPTMTPHQPTAMTYAPHTGLLWLVCFSFFCLLISCFAVHCTPSLCSLTTLLADRLTLSHMHCITMPLAPAYSSWYVFLSFFFFLFSANFLFCSPITAHPHYTPSPPSLPMDS